MKENRTKGKALKSLSELRRGKGESDGFVAEYILLSNPNTEKSKNNQ